MATFIREKDPERFFNILPDDWRVEIEPVWGDHESYATIYSLYDDGQVVAGGIVFRKYAPDIMSNESKSQKWMGRGYLYVGFLWVSPNRRNQNLGSIWLQCLKEKMPERPFWLAIEEPTLEHFYSKNGFVLEETITGANYIEWIMSYTPQAH